MHFNLLEIDIVHFSIRMAATVQAGRFYSSGGIYTGSGSIQEGVE